MGHARKFAETDNDSIAPLAAIARHWTKAWCSIAFEADLDRISPISDD